MFEGEADSVVAPAFDGEVGILPNHAPMMTLLGRGDAHRTERGRGAPVHGSGWVPPGRGQSGTRGGRTRTRRVSWVVTSAVGSWWSPCSPVRSERRRRRRRARRSSRRRTGHSTATSWGSRCPTRARASSLALEGFYRYGSGANDFSVRGGFADLNGSGRHPVPDRRRFPHPGRQLQRELPARWLAHPRPRRQRRRRAATRTTSRRHLPRPAVRARGLQHHLRPLRPPRHRPDLRRWRQRRELRPRPGRRHPLQRAVGHPRERRPGRHRRRRHQRRVSPLTLVADRNARPRTSATGRSR